MVVRVAVQLHALQMSDGCTGGGTTARTTDVRWLYGWRYDCTHYRCQYDMGQANLANNTGAGGGRVLGTLIYE
jgi:hypothetical protein